MNTWKWNQFGMLRSANDIDTYLSGREFTHGRYFHYTTLDAAESIFSKKAFWLANVSGFNDEMDKDQFHSTENYFSFCFSTGLNENLPLWYLYAGADGKGVRIALTKGAIQRSIEMGKYELYEKKQDKAGKYYLGDMVTALEKGQNMELTFRDIIYYKPSTNSDFCDLKYNTMTNHSLPLHEMNTYLENHVGFCKDLVWYYEKETRLLVCLSKDTTEKLNRNKEYVVVWTFLDDLLAHAKLMMAPDIKEEELAGVLRDKPSVSDIFLKSSHIKISEYAGKIHLSPCKKCKSGKVKDNV